MSASQTPTPAALNAMRISPGSGWGTGTSCNVSASGGPKRSTAAAFMVDGSSGALVADVFDFALGTGSPL
jgi:hypothetical protein